MVRTRHGRTCSTRVWAELTDADDVELEATLDKLLLDLLGDAVETDIALGVDGLLLGSVRGSHCGRRRPRD